LTVAHTETHWLLHWEGDFDMTSLAELKEALLEGLASGKALQLDLARAGAIDIAFLQLLWAAECAAARAGCGFVSRVSETAAAVARGAGFERFPGERPGLEALKG
jgi:anti-anti-sigma regulatory factor